MKKVIFALAIFCVSFTGCDPDDTVLPDPDPVPSPVPSEKGYVKGKVIDTKGNPIAGARIIIDNTIYYNSGMTTVTDANGNYSVKLQQGSWRAYAEIDRTFNGKVYPKLDLHPENPLSFSGEDAAVRNFKWKLQGEKPAPLTGHYGGTVYLGSDPNSDFYDIENVEFTFNPVGDLIDGNPGVPFTGKSGAARTDLFSKIIDVPMGRYTVTAKHIPTNKQLKILVEEQNTTYAPLATFDFNPELNYCRECVRLLVKP